jgi:hypothetical protein
VAADAVIESVEIGIAFRGGTGASIEGRLRQAAGRPVGNGRGLQVAINRRQKGEYRFTMNQPLVVARLIIKPGPTTRSGEVAGNNQLPKELQSWSGWQADGGPAQ